MITANEASMISLRVRTGEPTSEELAKAVANADIVIREAAEAGKSYIRMLFYDLDKTSTEAERRHDRIVRDHVCDRLREHGFTYKVMENDPLEVKVMWPVRENDPGL